ncbi:MAG: hypothetical protein AAFY99_05690 [Pseudomonadota bacterium]
MKMKRLSILLLGLTSLTGAAQAQTQATLQATQEGVFSASTPDIEVQLVLGPEVDGARTATISVLEGGASVFQTERPDLFSIFFGPIVHVVEMDGANDVPEVFISTYTGGAHCCNEVVVLSKNGDSWRSVDFGYFDGDPEGLYPADLNGDGQAEIKTYDNRFLYTFASYAGSYAPIQILGFKDGDVTDLTAESDFEWQVRAGLDEMGTMPEGGEVRNSWLAAQAAYLLTLGEADPLANAIDAHDATVDWGMIRCTVPEVDYSCPEGKSENIGFEAALTEFLTETGYLR